MRTLDRVEENLSAEHGMDQIKADQCITKLELLNSTEIPAALPIRSLHISDTGRETCR